MGTVPYRHNEYAKLFICIIYEHVHNHRKSAFATILVTSLLLCCTNCKTTEQHSSSNRMLRYDSTHMVTKDTAGTYTQYTRVKRKGRETELIIVLAQFLVIMALIFKK